jgi:hypothetical protein
LWAGQFLWALSQIERPYSRVSRVEAHRPIDVGETDGDGAAAAGPLRRDAVASRAAHNGIGLGPVSPGRRPCGFPGNASGRDSGRESAETATAGLLSRVMGCVHFGEHFPEPALLRLGILERQCANGRFRLNTANHSFLRSIIQGKLP